MTYSAIVKNGVITLPSDVRLEDGTEVEVVLRPRGTKLGDLLTFAGTWRGDDADSVLDLIYRARSSSPATLFD